MDADLFDGDYRMEGEAGLEFGEVGVEWSLGEGSFPGFFESLEDQVAKVSACVDVVIFLVAEDGTRANAVDEEG